MKKIFALFTALVLVIPSIALATPGTPHQFYGTVQYTNGAVSDGVTVEAKIGSIVVGSSDTKDGKYGYNLTQPLVKDSDYNLLLAIDPDGNRTGQTIRFYVGSVDTGQTAVFANAALTQFNLNVPITLTTTPTPPAPTPPTNNNTGGGSSGGVGGVMRGAGGARGRS